MTSPPAGSERRLTWVDSAEVDISALVDSLRVDQRLALDTESDPFHRYFEKVCLVQLSSRAEDVVIDPLAVGLPDPLRALLEDPAHTFVLHGADFDVRSLRRSFDLVLGRVFDTLIASSFLGMHGLGLKALLELELGIVIEKGEQRSDWGKRPLSAVQRAYATQDTRHLLQLADVLTAKLVERGRLAWMEEECEVLRVRCAQPPVPKVFDPEGWRKLKGARQLNGAGQRALRGAFVWREGVARRVDKPPFRVFVNEALVRLAEQIDRHGLPAAGELARSRLVPRGTDARELHAAIAEALASPLPPPPRGAPSPPASEGEGDAPVLGPLDAKAKARLELLKAGRKAWSESLGIDPGFLVSSSVLERVAREPPADLAALGSVRGMTAWRVEAVGAALLASLSS